MTDVIDTAAAVSPAPARRPRSKIRHRTLDELKQAQTLRPSEVQLLTGIPDSTVRDYCNFPPARRLPCTRIKGVRGRRGVILIKKSDLDDWLAWQEWCTHPTAEDLASAEFKSFLAWRASRAAGKGRAA